MALEMTRLELAEWLGSRYSEEGDDHEWHALLASVEQVETWRY